MNSHDKGVAYALTSHDSRQSIQQRANQIADITDAIHHGFKAEPDLAPYHLPLLSDDALERVFKESEKWRDKSRERGLEAELLKSREAEKVISDHYVNLRQILDSMDVPGSFRSVLGQPRHIAWTEQKARELVAKADDSDKLNSRNTELELIIQRARDAFVCLNVTAHEMYQMLGAARDVDTGGDWFMWATDAMPRGLSDDTMVEVVTCSGTKISAQAASVNWSVVREYRIVK